MRYHLAKFLKRAGDLFTILRVFFCEPSFILCYNSKIKLENIETGNLCIINSPVITKRAEELAKQGQTPDILYNPYRYPTETQKEYWARIRAGQLR